MLDACMRVDCFQFIYGSVDGVGFGLFFARLAVGLWVLLTGWAPVCRPRRSGAPNSFTASDHRDLAASDWQANLPRAAEAFVGLLRDLRERLVEIPV